MNDVILQKKALQSITGPFGISHTAITKYHKEMRTDDNQ